MRGDTVLSRFLATSECGECPAGLSGGGTEPSNGRPPDHPLFVPDAHYIQAVTTSSLPDPWVRPADGAAPGSGGLVDRHGRVATDLRVSLTDRCNLRCTYCMPPEGLDWLPKVEVLTDDEIVRLVRIGVEQLGIREVRFTGGEPLLRPGLVGIVAADDRAAPPARGQPHHQRDRPGPRRARRSPRPGWTGSTSAWTPSTATGSSSSPTATGSTTSSPGSPPRTTPG